MANTVDNTSRLPVSLYANSMEAFEELDRIYTEFLYEIHTGKRKRIVSPDALSATLPGSPNFRPVPYTDLTTDLYLILDTGEGREALRRLHAGDPRRSLPESHRCAAAPY